MFDKNSFAWCGCLTILTIICGCSVEGEGWECYITLFWGKYGSKLLLLFGTLVKKNYGFTGIGELNNGMFWICGRGKGEERARHISRDWQ